MMPIFLPHTMLDSPEALSLPELSEIQRRGRTALIAMRDKALAEGAQVMFVIWPGGTWTMLAIEPPVDATVTDASQLIPSLLLASEALAEFERRAKKGEYLGWLSLERSPPTLH
ncbi:hypothetical protein [Pseudomonas segetis]|nr:hypothetical protein [Pseudomonas segetis]